MTYQHIPVMLKEVIEGLHLRPGNIVVDATLGGGGYTRAMAEIIGPQGCVLAVDADLMAIDNARVGIKNFHWPQNITLIHDNFRNLQNIIKREGLDSINACVFDLGLSSAQLEDPKRGFSFSSVAPLVMDFNKEQAINDEQDSQTYKIINFKNKAELEQIIKEYGEERYAGRIAGAIVKNRPLRTTEELADVIKQAVPAGYERGRIHPATRTFQALRIATNDELVALRTALSQAVKILKPSGRVAVVSFHSLEDRIVKHFFKQEATDCLCPPKQPLCDCGHKPQLKIITKKAVPPSLVEIKNNVRARSAKLRIAEKI